MSPAAAFGQLRVLSGWHQGACVPLDTESGTLSLGAEANNDVVLRDAPFAQALLRWQAHTWQLEHEQTSLELPIGQALMWGEWRLVIDVPQAPWTYPQAQPWPAAEANAEPINAAVDPAPPPVLAPEPLPACHEDPASTGPDVAVPSTPWLQRMGQRRAMRLAGVGLCSLLAVAAVAAWTQLQGNAPPALPPTVAAEIPAPAAVDQAQLQAVLETAGLAHVVRVEKADGQRHALWGVVPDQEQLEALMRDVMGLTRKVIPHVLVQSEFEAHVQSLQPQLPPGIQISAEAGGQVWLSSDRQEPNALAEAIALVRRELPEAVQVRSGAAKPRPSPPGVSQAMGLPSIVAFQSGPQAYVLLANGERVLPGGQLHKMRLISVESQALVLEDATGQSRRFER